jgi:hypothetical protein
MLFFLLMFVGGNPPDVLLRLFDAERNGQPCYWRPLLLCNVVNELLCVVLLVLVFYQTLFRFTLLVSLTYSMILVSVVWLLSHCLRLEQLTFAVCVSSRFARAYLFQCHAYRLPRSHFTVMLE